jgi:hypothetical protein
VFLVIAKRFFSMTAIDKLNTKDLVSVAEAAMIRKVTKGQAHYRYRSRHCTRRQAHGGMECQAGSGRRLFLQNGD